MRLIKSNKIGYLQRTYGHGKAFFYTASPIVFFDLESSDILMENQQWMKVATALNGEALDHGLPKTCGEFLFSGNAYPPEEDCEEFDVGIQMGEKFKGLKVYGDRRWKQSIWRGTCPSNPESISNGVPLTWQNAYGGEKHKLNPFGTGFVRHTPMPNIEVIGQEVSAPGRKNSPAGFLPMPITWPQRARYQGKYKRDWVDRYFPSFPPDTDLRLFNASDKTQQLKGYFIGDEAYRLENLHPAQASFARCLPGVLVRAFIKTEDQLDELPLNLDTVWLFPEVNLGALIFRGQIQVKSIDAIEVTDLLLGYENITDEARPAAHYQDVFVLRTNRETALAHAMNEAQLSPVLTEQQKQEKQHKVVLQREKKIASIKDYQQKMLKHFHPKVVEAGSLPEPELTPADDLLEEDVKSGNFDLSPLIEHANKKTTEANIEADKRLKELYQKFPNATVDETKSLNEQEANENLAKTNNPNSLEQQALLASQLTIQPSEDLTVSPGATENLRKFVTGNLNNPQALICKNLTGADLSGLVFEGTDFSQAILSFANLSQCVFKNCNLSAAALVNANLSGCQFIGCDLKEVQLSGARGDEIAFLQCKIENVLWRNTTFNQVSCTDCSFTGCTWVKVTLPHSRLSNCQFSKCTLTQCTLFDCDFVSSEFNECLYSECNLQTGRWDNCRVQRTAMQLCKLQVCVFNNVTAHKWIFSSDADLRCCSWHFCELELTSFRNATMPRSCLSKSQFLNCDFSHADCSQSLLLNSKLQRCVAAQVDFRFSKLVQCNLFKSRFRGGHFQYSQLKTCNFLDADLMWAQFQNTRMKRCKNFSKVAIRDLKQTTDNPEKGNDQNRTARLA